jgi:hypothetical protein
MKNKQKRPKHIENGPAQCGNGVCGARPPRRIERRKGFPLPRLVVRCSRAPAPWAGEPRRYSLVARAPGLAWPPACAPLLQLQGRGRGSSNHIMAFTCFNTSIRSSKWAKITGIVEHVVTSKRIISSGPSSRVSRKDAAVNHPHRMISYSV